MILRDDDIVLEYNGYRYYAVEYIGIRYCLNYYKVRVCGKNITKPEPITHKQFVDLLKKLKVRV